MDSKPNSQNKNCWGQKEVRRSEANGCRALALQVTVAEVKGWQWLLPFLPQLLLLKPCQGLCVSHDTERNEGGELVFFLIVSVGSIKPDTKKVLPVQHSGKNAGFAFRQTWV